MAVTARDRVDRATRSPTIGVWVASGATDSMATNAISGRALLVATGAAQEIASRNPTVKARGRWIATYPARWMGVAATRRVAADAPLDVTGVASLGSVTTRAASRLRLRLDGMYR